MNILHITTYLQGGAGRIIRDLAIKQVENGHKVIIVITNVEEVGYENYKEYLDNFRDMKVPVYRVNSTFKRDIYLNIQAASSVAELIRTHNIDMIHSHATTPSMVSMIAKSSIKKFIPIIQTMHGWGTNKNKDHENMDVSILNMVNKVVTVSKSDATLLISKGVLKEKITTIYNGIDDLKDNESFDSNLKEELVSMEHNGDVIIGCIGSVCKRKNQQMIIEALAHITQSKVKVIFLGEGEEIDILKERAESYGISEKVNFYGYVDKAYLYIKYFDYIILPSLSEGLPLTILESFRDGKPVVSSDIDVFKEIIKEDTNGFIFDVTNVKNLVQVLEQAISLKNTEKYDYMSRRCKEDYESKYRLKEMLNKYMNIYEELLKK